MKKLKYFLMMLLCFPLVLFTGCGTKMVKPIDANYYFNSSVECSFFNQTSTRNLTLDDLSKSKPDTSLLDSYAQFVISPNTDTARAFHLYIDYITFYVYTNEGSDLDFTVNINLSNVIAESDVGKADVQDTFSDSYTSKPTAKGSMKFEIKVNRVIATTSGSTIKIDILNTDIYNTQNDNEVTFKWLIYGFELHAEPRAYNN